MGSICYLSETLTFIVTSDIFNIGGHFPGVNSVMESGTLDQRLSPPELENKMFGLTDIVALAKQGYKPSDIKELLELAQAAEPKPDETTQAETPDEKETIPEDKAEPVKEDPEKDAEALRAEIISLNDKIKELQKQTVRQDISGEVLTDEQKFEELVKNFY